MASLAALARTNSKLSEPEIGHLQRLVASWGMLADFCFSDLLLFVAMDAAVADRSGGPAADATDSADGTEVEAAEGEHGDDGAHDAVPALLVVGHVRPSTTQTLYRHDMIGERATAEERPMVMRSMELEEIIEGEITVRSIRERVRVLCIPVRYEGRTIAVLSREATPTVGRQPGELERTYVNIFHRFARMISMGEFPFATDDSDAKESPRVGDGAMVLDRSMAVEYASPNAVSALHRMGVHANTEGMRLGELGLDDEPVRDAFTVGMPVTQEIERGEVVIVLRCVPMLDPNGVSGAVVLFRDVSEVRRRDRLLLSKDATIREIHHRVKNNLQTISSLLQLQARRTDSDDAKAAIGESVRRISSIALVHETLSREAGEDVAFTEVLRPLVQMVAAAVSSPDRHIDFEVVGEAANLPAEVATPMAVVLTELLQNTADHAFPAGELRGRPNRVRIELSSTATSLTVRVIDNGVGLPVGFDVSQAEGLGMSIVRALVAGDLRGSIEASAPAEGPGAVVQVKVPLLPRT